MGFTWNPEKLTVTTKLKAIERFWSFVEKTESCWVWNGPKDKDGYGRIRPGTGKSYVRAHRFSYQLQIGEIPAGLHVLHACDNPSCVNPEHLKPGSNRDNINDMMQKDRTQHGDRHWRKISPNAGVRGEKVGTSKLTEDEVRAILARYSAGSSMRSLGREYGVSKTTVEKICHRIYWKHIPIPLPEAD